MLTKISFCYHICHLHDAISYDEWCGHVQYAHDKTAGAGVYWPEKSTHYCLVVIEDGLYETNQCVSLKDFRSR